MTIPTKTTQEMKYLNQLLDISQDRRNKSAIDIWGLILHAQRFSHQYSSINNDIIIGITAKDISFQLNMTLSSVYHNIKILQKQNSALLEEQDFSSLNNVGRRITQKVYRIPAIFFLEYMELLTKYFKDPSHLTHRAILIFNLLQVKGVLEYYSALLGSGRILVDDNFQEQKKWYSNWMDAINLQNKTILPGYPYSITQEMAQEVINFLESKLNKPKHKDIQKSISSGMKKENFHTFTFFIWPPSTKEMVSGDWITEQELISKKENHSTECVKDHPTFFKYKMECPKCGAKKTVKEKIEKQLAK